MSRFLESYRIVTFVPAEAAEDFAGKVTEFIPAFLGTYDKVCWWSEAGTEQFRAPGEEEVQRVNAVRLEFSAPRDEAVLTRIIEEGIKPHHPWKEPVILVFEHKIHDHGTS